MESMACQVITFMNCQLRNKKWEVSGSGNGKCKGIERQEMRNVNRGV